MIYDYRCPICGKSVTLITTVEKRDDVRLCYGAPPYRDCPGILDRVMSRPHFTMGANASRFDDHNARHKAWKETPEVVAKLRSGEYEERRPTT